MAIAECKMRMQRSVHIAPLLLEGNKEKKLSQLGQRLDTLIELQLRPVTTVSVSHVQLPLTGGHGYTG